MTPDNPPKMLDIYRNLLNAFGPRHWWPAKTPFEVMVGAVLTQAVAWRNVQKAIANLEQRGLMSPEKIYHSSTAELEELLRPTRYFKMKTKKLQALIRFLVDEYQGSLERLFKEELIPLRKKLLAVYGLGPETVDSILLYAGGLPVFVVDEYTRRIFWRLGFTPEKISYQKLQEFFTANLPAEVQLYNEFHALIDHLGNRFCHTNPDCLPCPLKEICHYKNSLADQTTTNSCGSRPPNQPADPVKPGKKRANNNPLNSKPGLTARKKIKAVKNPPN